MSSERTPPSSSVPDLLIERLALEDLDPALAAAVRARLEAAGGAQRLADLAASNSEILAAHPPAAVQAEVQRRLGAGGPVASPVAPARRFLRGWPGGLALGMATAAAAVVLVVRRPDPGVLAPEVGPPSSSPAGETIVLKGLRPHLIIYKKTASGPARLTDQSRVRPGDTLQVAYVAAGHRFGVVASQDARGSVTFHLPTEGGRAAALGQQGETPAANAFELDDSPGFERFVFVTADEPFSISVVLEALRAGADAGLPRGASMTTIVLPKEVR
jgi:hypothetical protein